MESAFIVLIIAMMLLGITANIVGIIAAFKKKWYLGIVALVVPGFATVVGLGKMCKKDLLK